MMWYAHIELTLAHCALAWAVGVAHADMNMKRIVYAAIGLGLLALLVGGIVWALVGRGVPGLLAGRELPGPTSGKGGEDGLPRPRSWDDL